MAANHSHASEKFHVSKTSNEEEEYNSHSSQKVHPSKTGNENVYEQTFKKYREMLETLPKERAGWNVGHLYRYQGFWFGPAFSLKGILLLQNLFEARPTDIFVASLPKGGSTWLRALAFAVVNRTTYQDFSDHPLLRLNPRDLAPFLDALISQNSALTKLELLPEPRFLSTHFPYNLFPRSVKTLSGCKFVYICRNPKDTFVSAWHFFNKLRSKEELPPISLQQGFEHFCEGTVEYGPFWDHVLDYWKASLEFPDKVLFLKFEDLKREPSVHIKRLADFFGRPFSPEEESEGVVREIIKLCSFEQMSNLEVNKKDGQPVAAGMVVKNSDFFRKGQVGDWVNHLTQDMAERLDRVTEDKLSGSGLSFDSPL